jgi:hypothetical protein
MDIDLGFERDTTRNAFWRVLKLSVLVWLSPVLVLNEMVLVLVLDAEFSSTSTANAECEYEKPWNNKQVFDSERLGNRNIQRNERG